ncbi:MAG TPA: hypothetical protein VIW69_07125 [Candidatus Elarobacter sp.]
MRVVGFFLQRVQKREPARNLVRANESCARQHPRRDRLVARCEPRERVDRAQRILRAI